VNHDLGAADVDAVLLLSFGGPHGPDDVLPFLRNVTAGRGVPDERLATVAEHYVPVQGVSPITGQNRALIAALQAELAGRGVELPIYFGNRNWSPYVTDTMAAMTEDGVRHALVLATSATSSYSGCRQYREDLARASESVTAAGQSPPRLTKLRHYFDHPGFIAANVSAVQAALLTLPAIERATARLVFSAHSIPVTMNDTSGPDGGLYLSQQRETARLVTERVRGSGATFDLVWQSRSGPPQVRWLEPDINDHLQSLVDAGERAVVVIPTGFISDHMEVLWDLDTEAAATAAKLGLAFARAATAGTDPDFVAALADLVMEQLTPTPARQLSELGLCGIDCPADCCPRPRRPGVADTPVSHI
jgi:protoporphyrin/coproporphyrin ferrochelatase